MKNFLYAISILSVKLVIFSESVSINDYGEYENIYIGISPRIPTSQLEYVLQEMEDLFRESSKFLRSATKNSFSFKEVTFVLPKIFNFSTLKENWIPKMDHVAYPDIYVLEEGLFQENPYTIQHKGCGESGLKINIPVKFFKNNRTYKIQNFIHEWAHYRYGVFDENGFLDDPLYPLLYSPPGKDNKEIEVIDCTNMNLSYVFKDKNGQTCQPTDNEEEEEKCLPYPLIEQVKQNSLSSLMNKPFFPQTDQFCDDEYYAHNKDAPSKQNALCKEQSVWNVIKNHEDYKKRANIKAVATPSFGYIVESDAHIIFLIEATNNLRDKGRIEYIRNAFSYFVLFDLPNHSKVTFLDMRTSEITSTVRVGENTDRIFDSFPEAYEGDNVCVHCSIKMALEVLKKDPDITKRFMVLIGTTDIIAKEVQAITDELHSANIKLFAIYFGSELKSPPLLNGITTATSGQTYVILEDTKHHKFLSPLTIAYEVFRSIYEHFFWLFRNRVLVDQKIFYEDSSENSIEFEIEENVELLHVIITGLQFRAEPPVVKNTVKLIFNDTEYSPSDESFTYKIIIPAYLFTIKNPQAGTWRLQFQKKPMQKKPLEVIIRSAANDSRNITNAKAWISNKGIEKKPITIFSEIYKGIHPVIKVNTSAFIIEHTTGKEIILELQDIGNGDPDITKNDGIYSKYLTNISREGFYTLAVVSKTMKNYTEEESETHGDITNCCGSIIHEKFSANTTNFSRIVVYGSFFVQHVLQEIDLAPSRITDLHVANVEPKENGVKHYTLQWTAPGAYLDSGTASKYEIKVFQSRTDALHNFEKNGVQVIDMWSIHGWLETKPAGTVHTSIIELRNLETGLYFLSMRALNSNGNASDISNVIKLYFTKPSLEIGTSVTDFTNQSTPDPGNGPIEEANDTKVGIIIGISCGVLFLFFIIGIILLVSLSNKRKFNKNKKAPLSISAPYIPRNSSQSNGTPINSLYSSPHVQQHSSSLQRQKSDDHKVSSNMVPTTSCATNMPDNDDASIASYSNSRIYIIDDYASDQKHFYDVPLRDDTSPSFNPTHTSSLRRIKENDNLSYRLGTDV